MSIRKEQCNKVCRILDDVLANRPNERDSLIIATEKAFAEPRWIPCSERLPEKDTCFYLGTIANHGLNFTTTLPDDVDVVRWDYDRRKGRDSWHWCTERTVIAWMPRPKPYQNGKQNG